MTRQKQFKQRVRARMAKTGERYAAARRQLLRDLLAAEASPTAAAVASGPHFSGNVAPTTALRCVLHQAGFRDPRTGGPLSEAALFAIAGGVGIGVCSFYYEKEAVATFFIAGRHRWHDDLAYLTNACERLGASPELRESTSAAKAAAQLRETLAEHGACVAWVDAGSLPHRAMPARWTGGGYHVVTVYAVDDEAATIGDLTDEPIRVPLRDFAAARARIKKQRNRLLAVPHPHGAKLDLRAAFRAGLQACHAGLSGEGAIKAFAGSFTLEALRRWAAQLEDGKGKDRWERVFAPGGRLWEGLTSVHDFVEHYGTGGGLCRPLFAEGLLEAADVLRKPKLRDLSAQYSQLGHDWSALADEALPDDVPLLRQAKELLVRKAELMHAGAAAEELRTLWAELDALAAKAKERFPLGDADCADLRRRLHRRVQALHEAETAAHEALGATVS